MTSTEKEALPVEKQVVTPSEKQALPPSDLEHHVVTKGDIDMVESGSSSDNDLGFDEKSTKALIRKMDWALLPFLALLYLLSFLDRSTSTLDEFALRRFHAPCVNNHACDNGHLLTLKPWCSEHRKRSPGRLGGRFGHGWPRLQRAYRSFDWTSAIYNTNTPTGRLGYLLPVLCRRRNPVQYDDEAHPSVFLDPHHYGRLGRLLYSDGYRQELRRLAGGARGLGCCRGRPFPWSHILHHSVSTTSFITCSS
jgi:hypothetical protein